LNNRPCVNSTPLLEKQKGSSGRFDSTLSMRVMALVSTVVRQRLDSPQI
jgi:hypothetical protein